MDALDGRQYDGRDLKISIDAGRPTRYTPPLLFYFNNIQIVKNIFLFFLIDVRHVCAIFKELLVQGGEFNDVLGYK